ncbi:MAG: AAA family ATPase [Gammaproteobacteria bacterium]|nr:AAA family ATPase [Gammaproteobacteria bacterium]
MYLDHFNLSCRPFEEIPDHRFLYLSPQHSRALANIEYALTTRDSFVAIAGEIGMGKTTLLNQVFADLPNSVSVARVTHTTLTPIELLHTLLNEFGLQTYKKNKVFCLDKLREFFAAEKAAGRQVVILVDEAQNLSVKALEELRLLSSMDLELAGLVSVVLVGQPQLNALLDSPQLEQLRQRVRLRQHLMPLSQDETRAYIDKRLEIAGSSAEAIFSPDAVDRVYVYTAGVPRLINTLCEAVLTSSWTEDETKVEADRVDEVAAELGWRERHLDGPVPPAAATTGVDDTDERRMVYGWLRRTLQEANEYWVPIYNLPFTIGRTSDNRLRLSHAHISRKHAAIEQIGEDLCICDKGSRNGTFLNGEKIQSAPLKDGDRVAFGNVELIFQALISAPATSAS